MATKGARLGANPHAGKGDPDASDIGNRVGEVDPRGTYGENQSEPTNIYGERAQRVQSRSETGGGAGQFPAQRAPVPKAWDLPPGVVPAPLRHGRVSDPSGQEPRAGAGLMDSEAEKALGLGIYGIQPMRSDADVKRAKFNLMLGAYEQFARNIQQNLLELRALDPAWFDSQYPHLRKVNLPKPVPDPIPPGFTTFEALLFEQGTAPLPKTSSAFSPGHAEFVPLSDDEKLLHYSAGGYVDMPLSLCESRGVTRQEVIDATNRADARLIAFGIEPMNSAMERRRSEQLFEAHRRATAPAKPAAQPRPGPQPWKEAQ